MDLGSWNLPTWISLEENRPGKTCMCILISWNVFTHILYLLFFAKKQLPEQANCLVYLKLHGSVVIQLALFYRKPAGVIQAVEIQNSKLHTFLRQSTGMKFQFLTYVLYGEGKKNHIPGIRRERQPMEKNIVQLPEIKQIDFTKNEK